MKPVTLENVLDVWSPALGSLECGCSAVFIGGEFFIRPSGDNNGLGGWVRSEEAEARAFDWWHLPECSCEICDPC